MREGGALQALPLHRLYHPVTRNVSPWQSLSLPPETLCASSPAVL